MPINEYGIYVRALRKKNNQNLNDMAKLMGVSISFLSALEVGKKTIPLDIADRVAKIYNLTDDELIDLRNKIDLSNNRIHLSLDNMDDEHKDISLAFARTINTASQKKLEELRKLLLESDEK